MMTSLTTTVSIPTSTCQVVSKCSYVSTCEGIYHSLLPVTVMMEFFPLALTPSTRLMQLHLLGSFNVAVDIYWVQRRVMSQAFKFPR